ncbi:hypothetical protein CDAR_100721 [Caerostris darwini]|uniref:Secreted protein n=1 Tax=Caerostris darwini TaxID=1538125 RepID=A0AAV4M7D5_9ARAC|nr:hypothetical protein CDAR_100721 [Caerostris darwini]
MVEFFAIASAAPRQACLSSLSLQCWVSAWCSWLKSHQYHAVAQMLPAHSLQRRKLTFVGGVTRLFNLSWFTRFRAVASGWRHIDSLREFPAVTIVIAIYNWPHIFRSAQRFKSITIYYSTAVEDFEATRKEAIAT